MLYSHHPYPHEHAVGYLNMNGTIGVQEETVDCRGQLAGTEVPC